MSITIEQIVDGILDGAADENMDTLYAAIKQRRKTSESRKILFIKVGDKVRFNSTANPKYLQGHIGEVVKVNQNTVSVNLPEDYSLRKYSGSRGVRCPISIVDKVEGDDN